MTKSVLLFLFAIAFIQSVRAQSSLSGDIIDEKNNPVFFATVVLYNQSDSSIANSSLSGEKGDFEIKGIKPGKYYLEIRFVGYQEKTIDGLEFPRDNNSNLSLQMEPSHNELSEVVVIAKKQLLEQGSDRLIVNVSDNISGSDNSLMDVMKKVPGVIVMGDKISLAGSSNLTILIDGKTTKYMDISSLLKDMPGDNIEKIEIIHQPGAEFDASGSGPIINIILKKNKLFGTFGSVNTGISKGDSWRYNTNASFTQYQGNVNISGSAGYQNSEYKSRMDIDRYVDDDLYDQSSYNNNSWDTYRGNLNIDWNMNTKHRMGVQSRFIKYDSDDLVLTNLDIFSGNSLNISSNTSNNRDGFWRFGSVNPYYTFEIDSMGQKLDIDFNYIQYGSKDKNYLVERETSDETILAENRMSQPGTTKISVAKLDYTYPASEYLKLQVGAKYSFADLDNDFQYEELINGIWEPSGQSNHFLFKETIYAGYGKLSYNKSKWAGTLGLRYEDSRSEGKSEGIDTVLTRRIAKFFPSGSISRDISKNIKGILAYSYRLDRPRYSSLNPFRYNLDAYTYEKGNPDIKAEFTHSMKFSLAFQNQPFFNVEYKLTKDPITQVYGQNEETGEAFRGDDNLDKRNVFNTSLYFPLDFIPKISGYGGVIVNNLFFDTKYLNDAYLISKWDYIAFLQMKFTLPWNVLTELSGYYTSGGLEGTMTYEYMYGASIGVGKKFLNDKVNVNLGVENFISRFFYGKLKYNTLDVLIYNEWEAPVVNLKVSYNFGNKHLKYEKHESGSLEELNRTGKN